MLQNLIKYKNNYKKKIIQKMNQNNHNNNGNNGVTILNNLTYQQIHQLSRLQAQRYVGVEMTLSEQQKTLCQVPLNYIHQRIEYLKLQEVIDSKQAANNELKKTIDGLGRELEKKQTTINELKEEKKCWRCYFLEKARLGEIIISLLVTIAVSLIGIEFVAVEELTSGQKIARKKALIANGIIAGLIVLLLISWVIGRNCFLVHTHTQIQQAIER